MKEEIYEIPDVHFITNREKLKMLITRVLVILNRLHLQQINCNYIETSLLLQVCFMDDQRYMFNHLPVQFAYNNVAINQVFSEEDPYGEETWENENNDSQLIYVGQIFQKSVIVDTKKYDDKVIYFKDFNGEILYTLRINDPNDVLL